MKSRMRKRMSALGGLDRHGARAGVAGVAGVGGVYGRMRPGEFGKNLKGTGESYVFRF